jgi:hypothetical protein
MNDIYRKKVKKYKYKYKYLKLKNNYIAEGGGIDFDNITDIARSSGNYLVNINKSRDTIIKTNDSINKYDIYKSRIEAIKKLEIFEEIKKLIQIKETTDINKLNELLTNKDYKDYNKDIKNKIFYKKINNIKNLLHCFLDKKILYIIIEEIKKKTIKNLI